MIHWFAWVAIRQKTASLINARLPSDPFPNRLMFLDHSHRLFLVFAGYVATPIAHFISLEVGDLIGTV